jgi:cyclic pyranopterin monophosphate synthase
MRKPPKTKLSHYKDSGQVSMVDVSAKPVTTRTAIAQAFVTMKPVVVRAVRRLKNPKGDPLEVARIAGIAAAKRTAEWIPLCHPLPLTHIAVTARLCQNGVSLRSTVATAAQTGVEMEALVAVSAAALTVYDMCKALDKSMEITDIALLEKTGGKSGDYRRVGDDRPARAGGKARKPARRGT